MVHFRIDKSPKLRAKRHLKGEKYNSFCSTKFVEFCKRTDLHGYKYIVMDDLNIIERVFWVFAVAISIVLAVCLVMTAYQWYARNPIVTVIESTQGAVWDIPFPAVTICDLNIISKSAAVALVNNITLPENVSTKEALEMFRLSPLLHSLYLVSPERKHILHKLQNVLDINQLSIEVMFKKVFIDNSYNVPNVDSPVRMVNPATEVLIALSPESTYTTPGVKSFTAEERQCFYNDEVELGNLRQYSFHNCIAYQRVELIRNLCECVPFYFPVKDYHRTCNYNDLECLETILVRKDVTEDNSKMDHAFRCLPECEHFDYPLEVAFGKLARNARMGSSLFSDVKLENHSVVNVFFNDLVSTRYRRDVYLNWQNLLASFGGLLSLMLGFTLISGFDLVIFFIFGIVCSSITTISNTNSTHSTPFTKDIKPNKVYVKHHKKVSNYSKRSLSKSEDDYVKWKIDAIHLGDKDRY